jgi:hypothetical protein
MRQVVSDFDLDLVVDPNVDPFDEDRFLDALDRLVERRLRGNPALQTSNSGHLPGIENPCAETAEIPANTEETREFAAKRAGLGSHTTHKTTSGGTPAADGRSITTGDERQAG